jgi:hypothetical protein
LGVRGQAAASRTPGVVDLAVTSRPGDVVGGTGSFLDRLGWVIAAGPERAAVQKAAEAALAQLHVMVEPAAAERRAG